MKKIIFVLFLLFIFYPCFSQSNWVKIILDDWGEIKIPPTMEMQSGVYKKILDRTKKHFSVDATRVVLQQKGVNEGKNLNTYARIIIRTDFVGKALPDLNKQKLTKQEMEGLNQMFRHQIDRTSEQSPFSIKILKWINLSTITLNGNTAIHFSYIREQDGKQTFSTFYLFWNGHQQHSLNMEYRIRDSSRWKSVLERAIHSFKLR